MDTDQPKKKNSFAAGIPKVWSLGIALMSGVALGWLGSMGCSASKNNLNYALMQQAWGTIQRHYVDHSAVKPVSATYGAIEGMVDSLGDTGHSAFLSPEMVKNLKTTESGEFKGIGIEIQMKAGHVVVVAPIDGSPAQRAGLRSRDIILKVSGEDITGWPLTKVVHKITGRPGTSVTLTILNPRTGHTRDVTITRATIKLHDVTWHRLPGTSVAHLRIASFDGGVGKDLVKALKEIHRQKLDGIVLDLRNNPGGILHQAVVVASQFLSGGNVLLVKNAKGQTTSVGVEKGGVATNLPMAVLVNEGTASAAEILAGALRDRHRAALVGKTTFGTGTVLREFSLYDGSALLLAVEEWLTPDGHSFWHKGIKPGYIVSLPDDTLPVLPEAEKGMTAAQLQSSGDKQLLRALSLVNQKIDKTAERAPAKTAAQGNP